MRGHWIGYQVTDASRGRIEDEYEDEDEDEEVAPWKPV
jgi:hypothetical protein